MKNISEIETKKALPSVKTDFRAFSQSRQNRKSEIGRGVTRDIYISTTRTEIAYIFPKPFPKISTVKSELDQSSLSSLLTTSKGGFSSC